MRKMIHLVLALVCAISFAANVSAQGVDQPEKPKAAKKAKAAKESKAKQAFAKYFGAAQLTQEQHAQLKSLRVEQKESLGAIREELGQLVSKDEGKALRAGVRDAMKAGKSKAAAQQAALSASNLSAEVQAQVTSLQQQRDKIEQDIVDQITATFSEEQKAAMKAKKVRGQKGDKKAKKPKKNKKAKKAEQPQE